MIDVQEAIDLINKNIIDYGDEEIIFTKSNNRILAQKVSTDRDLPPYNRVAMDGVAIRYSGLQNQNSIFTIIGIAPAGTPQKSIQNDHECIEVMTGAVLPQGADTVIRYEDLDIHKKEAKVLISKISKGQNIHIQGSDTVKGSTVLQSGDTIRSQEIGILASIGAYYIKVKKCPKTIIISTGDELVDVDQTVEPHQIRKSNVYSISNLLSTIGIIADHKHIADNKENIKAALTSILTEYHLVILSGGVSKGKFDFIPEVLEELEVKKIFHKVKQRPGKPLWFGRKNNTIIFGLPGNPVSSFVCTRKYIYHWLEKSMSISPCKKVYARLANDFTFNPDLNLYQLVHISTSDQGHLLAKPISGNGSGDFISLKNANAFMEIPKGKSHYSEGEVYPILPFS